MLLPVLSLLAVLPACGDARDGHDDAAGHARGRIGLVSSLPIYWNASGDIAEALADTAPPHWALRTMREYGAVVPIDDLAAADGAVPLPRDALLILAQPYPFAPQENVALDRWVRGGGHVLLFADPLLTQDSPFPVGDRRRPQDVILLSPILKRWGLDLFFDDGQAAGEHTVAALGTPMPVNLPGFLKKTGDGGRCALEAGGLVAQCRIGRGAILVVADSAILENRADDAAELRKNALRRLIDRALG